MSLEVQYLYVNMCILCRLRMINLASLSLRFIISSEITVYTILNKIKFW